MDHKEEIATQWVTLGSDMKQKYDNLKIEFIEYKIANDISRFIEDVRSEKSDEILGSKIRNAIEGNILYIDWQSIQTIVTNLLFLLSMSKYMQRNSYYKDRHSLILSILGK